VQRRTLRMVIIVVAIVVVASMIGLAFLGRPVLWQPTPERTQPGQSSQRPQPAVIRLCVLPVGQTPLPVPGTVSGAKL
jgi:hypothetical protein